MVGEVFEEDVPCLAEVVQVLECILDLFGWDLRSTVSFIVKQSSPRIL